MVDTLEFGLIGREISHSFSADYFSRKFSAERINAAYRNYDLQSIHQLTQILDDNPGLKGLNVTSPYKREVITFLDSLSDAAQALQAVNTVKIFHNNDGKKILEGHNTDAEGFRQTLKNLHIVGTIRPHALVLGTGGAASAVAYALRQEGITYDIVSRNPKDASQTFDANIIDYAEASNRVETSPLIINATPVGMWPKTDAMPPLDMSKVGRGHIIYDLIYNPSETLFMKEARMRGATTFNGMQMLLNQADLSWKIWNA